MTISLDPNMLLSYYQLKAGIVGGVSPSGSGSSSSGTAAKPANPTPPWTTAATAGQTSALVQSVLNGQPFINTNAVKIDVAGASQNYKNLFGLYQGLTALQDLATQASATTTSAAQLKQIQRAFASGLKQVQTFLASAPFQGFQVAQGTDKTQQQSGVAGTATSTGNYTTGVLYTGDPNAAVPAFQGNLSFSATFTRISGAPTTVNFNLNDLGSTPRTMGNVVSYLNSQLAAAGVQTRFADVATPSPPQTVIGPGGKTVTLPAGPQQYALKVVGSATETVSFSDPSATPAVYVTQTSGLTTPAPSTDASSTTAKTATTTPASTATQQLLKLNPSAATPKVFTDSLGQQVTNVTGTATAPDGSVYVLADINGATSAGEIDAGHTIIGSQSVALLKYDSAGNLLYTRTLGDASTASGLSLSVSPDGSKVAIAGTVTGALTGTNEPANVANPSSFVSVFNGQGDPVWTARQDTASGDQANSVVVANDGSAYVGGSAQSALTGAGVTSTSTAYLTGYSASGVQTFTTQFGGAGQNRVNGVALDGSSIITAGVENGDAVVRSYAIQPSGPPTLTTTRDLGALQGGGVAGVSVAADGSVIVAGTTHNGSLSAGTTTNAYTGGSEAFVANLGSADLSPSGSDTLAYYSAGGDTTASAVTTSNGQVYITGQVAVTPLASSQTTAFNGYAAQIDPTTGAAVWSDQFTGAGQQAAPSGIAVNPAGSSVLDAFGLPTGTLNTKPSTLVIDNTDLRVGDQFSIGTNGVLGKVTIAATDTLQTLAAKIQRAAGAQVTVKVIVGGGGHELQISPVNQQVKVNIAAGPNGSNALPGLGLYEGVITNPTTVGVVPSTKNSLHASYGLNLYSTLNLSTPADVKNALAALKYSISSVKQIYSDAITVPSKKTPGSNGTASPEILSELANYQAALTRLTASGSSSSSGSLLSLLSG
jgi:hypothetical protein